MQELKKALADAAKKLFEVEVESELTRPDEQFGDYSTNVAMQIAAKTGKKPREIAEQLVAELNHPSISKAEVADPGFINIFLTDEALLKMLEQKPVQTWAGKTVVAEYSDPNPFKVLHAGHLYTSIVGDAIANLYQVAGAKVHRVNFGGDVGLHVAKAMWSIVGKLDGEHPEKLKEIPKNERTEWLTEQYVSGSLAYGDDERIDNEVKDLNQRIYKIINENDHDSDLAQIYWETRQWSYDYFEEFYKQIGSGFEKYYPESETTDIGLGVVKANIGKVFEESDGAIVFKGEVHNLHTRVFINSQGLPTYETKDVGLIFKKWEDYHFDRSLIITANDIHEYMQVVLKAIEQIEPVLAQKTTHLTHGVVKLAGGEKMSSRKGNILRATDVLEAAAKASQKDQPEVTLGAVKYSFLKQRLGADIIYDPAESVSIEGNSGPYLQYAYVRAKNILNKAGKNRQSTDMKLEPGERSLARKIGEYSEVVEQATSELLPSHVCTYLYELAQVFNRFYEKSRVIGDNRETLRLKLVRSYADVLKNGLNLLNIKAPERM